MIDFALSEDQRLVLETVRRFAAEELRPRARLLERAGGLPDELVRTFQALELTLCDVPEALGGLGVGAVTAALVHEELAFGDPGAAVALWGPHLLPAALLELADEAQARRLLAPFAEGRAASGAVAWTGDATARRAGEAWILDGEKRHVVNAGRAAWTIVFAGGEAFAVPAGAAGLEAGPRARWLGLETVAAGSLRLAGVRVPEADRLTQGADPVRVRRFFARAALVTAARQVGLARAAFETALAYTQDRIAFGKPVAHFQAVSFMLADMHMDVESARWLVWRGASELEQGLASAPSSLFKASVHANEAAWRVADCAVQLLGGAGYLQDFLPEKWLRDTKALGFLGGVDQFAQLAIAGELLGHPLCDAGPETTLQTVGT